MLTYTTLNSIEGSLCMARRLIQASKSSVVSDQSLERMRAVLVTVGPLSLGFCELPINVDGRVGKLEHETQDNKVPANIH